jgi:pilus assembly protein CpaB
MAERRYNIVFVTALVVAIAATYGVYRVLQQVKASSAVKTQSVVVAARNIGEGERIGRFSVEARPWPTGTAPEGAYAVTDSLIGRVARVPIFTGEAVVAGRLAPPGVGPGIEVKIAPGMRAMAVRINDVVGLGGLIQPNSRVDVLVTLRSPDGAGKEEAKLFMSNMRVLSVGSQVERGSDGNSSNATTAALEVTPEEAERLAIATHQGSIQLVLRGYGDPDSVTTSGATTADVLAQLRSASARTVEDPPPAARRRAPAPRPQPVSQAVPPPAVPETVFQRAAPPESLEVRVYHGDKVTKQKFASDSTRTPRPEGRQPGGWLATPSTGATR